MVPNGLHAIAEIVTASILNSLVAGIAVALLAWVVTHLCSRQGAGTRFAVWFSALVAIAILPWFCHLGVSPIRAVSGVARSAVTLPATDATYLFVAWLIGATLGLLRVGSSLYRLRQLRSGCTPVDLNQFGAKLLASLAEIQAHRPVTLCSSEVVRVPASIGYFRPVVVFPTWTLQEIAPAELEAILLHELAHLRRWDDWTNLAQKVARALFFFHPAVWFIESQLALEREMACDDAVLAANFNPRAYAESLLALAEKSLLRRGVQLAQAAVSHIQQLKTRIVEILRKDRAGGGRVWKPALALMALAGILCGYGVSRGPQLVAFSSDGTQVASSAASTNVDSPLGVAAVRPVNWSFVASSPEVSRVSHATRAARLRIVQRVAPKRIVALAQREARPRFLEDEITAPPMLVLANFTMAQPLMGASVVLVVMQNERFGIDGPVFWRLTVVHLIQVQQRAITGGTPKQT